MNYGQARQLLSENATFEKAVTNTGEKLLWNNIKAYETDDDGLLIKKCDVYIKVLKHDCPIHIKDNKSLNMQNKCQKNCNCKMLFDVSHGKLNDRRQFGVYEYFPKISTLAENTFQYFILKFSFYDIKKTELYDRCNEMIERLSEPCADCLEDKWKDVSITKFKILRNVLQNSQDR